MWFALILSYYYKQDIREIIPENAKLVQSRVCQNFTNVSLQLFYAFKTFVFTVVIF